MDVGGRLDICLREVSVSANLSGPAMRGIASSSTDGCSRVRPGLFGMNNESKATDSKKTAQWKEVSNQVSE